MIKHYFKAAFASIIKQKWLSLINIVGLAFGISLCFVIITILQDQFSFDKFHANADRIYRINTQALRVNGETEDYASTVYPMATTIKDKFPYAKKVVRLSSLNTEIADSNNVFNSAGFFADPEFFQVFGFDLLFGNKAVALSNPFNVILTERTAAKIFNNQNPVGKILELKGVGNFTISGVMKEPPGKTHLQFDFLCSGPTLPLLEKENLTLPVTNNWKNYYSNYVYVLLKNKSNATQLENDLADISKKQYASLTLESRDKAYKFYLQPLNKIVPGPELSNNMGKALPEIFLWMLGLFAIVIIISACFNYGSLSVALSLRKAKEIGIRKTIGAMRYQLVIQFLIESVVTTLFAFVLSTFIFHFFLKPFFSNLSLANDFDMSLNESVSLYVLFFLFSLIVAVISGVFPALYLSSFKPSKTLKDSGLSKFSPKLTLRKVLLVTQFSAALIFSITLVNLMRQMNYVLNADYGFTKDNILNIDLEGNNYETVKRAFQSNKDVQQVSGISHSLGTFRDRRIDVRVNEGDEKFAAMDYTIDKDYISNLGLQLIAGKNFSNDLPADRELFIIVNESFLRFYHLGNAADAIGKTVILDNDKKVTVGGVLKDFHFKPFTYAILPLVFRYNFSDITQLNIKITGNNTAATIASFQKIWQSFDKEHSFSYRFFDDELKQTYAPYEDIVKLISIVALMSVTIAFLGLIALVFFTLQQKLKEVSIRKVFGASLPQLYALLSKSFLQLLLITALLAIPLTVFLDNFLMQQFAYTVNQSLSYIIGVGILLLISFFAIAIQVWKVAIANPVKSLRTE